MPELDRRDFLKIVGVGAGAAAAAGCSDPIEKLVPYVIQPESVTPGISTIYASTCQECSVGCGLHVKTREGRPIKLEGNPEHPINRGALCGRGQVGLSRTYHPDRYDGPLVRSSAGTLESISWEDALAKLTTKIKASPGGTWVFGAPAGPSLDGVVDAFVSGVGAGGRTIYEPFSKDALRSATEQVFGVAAVPVFDLSGTDLIIDFGADTLDSGLSPVEHSRQIADARDVKKNANGGARLVSVSPRMNLTTESADEWLPAKPGSEGVIALALAKAVGEMKGVGGALASALSGADSSKAASQSGIDAADIEALAAKLIKAKRAVALPPGVAVTSSAATQANAAVLLLNDVLGATGGAMRIPSTADASAPANMAEIKTLIAAMQAGKVKVLLIHGANPLYSLPASAGFAEALTKVDTVVSFAPLKDETAEIANLVLPDHTPMESWGDAAPRDGVRSVVQPTVRPLKDTKAFGDTLLEIGRAVGATMPEGTFHDVVKANWADTDWTTALSTGGVFAEGAGGSAATASAAGLSIATPKFEGSGDFMLVAYPSSFLSDGSGAALPWMQEVPDPVTKLSWGSWIEMSFANAEKIGVGFGDVVSVTTDAGTIEASAFPRGGIREDVIAVPIGQGHTVGHYASMEGDGEPGVARGTNVISILGTATDSSGARVWLGSKVSIQKTGAYRRLPLAQWTDNQHKRQLAPQMSLLALAEGTHKVAHFEAAAASPDEGKGDDHAQEYDGAPGHGHHDGPPYEYDPAYDADPNQPYRWGMVIDNDRCNGCSACTVACYVENNISLVGEVQAIQHREMTWLRIERYIGDGNPDGGESRRPFPNLERLGKTDVRHLPMPCQHCGSAPCEAVCPVIGTYHTKEGINGMVYNRCVGTRYCANNCTYKVRRFNYWDYGNDNWPGMLGLMLNPDVTVRQQGVMEKCSFCVQRIETARQPAKNEGRNIADGEVITACQQSCPSGAITFGNWKDEGSEIVKLTTDEKRVYRPLQELNTRPAVTYLAQVTREDQEGQH